MHMKWGFSRISTMFSMHWCCRLFVVGVVVTLFHSSFASDPLKSNGLAKDISTALHSLHEQATSYSTLLDSYKEVDINVTSFNDTHWHDILDRMSDQTNRTIDVREKKLSKLADKLERNISQHVHITSEPSYSDSAYERKGRPEFTTADEGWYYSANKNISAVFVPVVEINDSDTNNGIAWTENLISDESPPADGYFIGTIHGVLRFYPGTPWPERYDMYDCRHQSWFLQAASSQHDIAILIDRSGSVFGITLRTIKRIARFIINLIPANYRFNVFLFNNETIPLKKCFGGDPIPASEFVKSAFLYELESIEAGLPGLLNDALQTLEETFFNKSVDDTTCKKMIILFTDGKIDFNLKKVKETLARLNLKLLVLDFSSPLSFGPNEQLKEMTSAVYGHYQFVRRMEDWFQVADMFFHIVSTQSVKDVSVRSPRWSDPIVTFYNKKSMLLSYPLYNLTANEQEEDHEAGGHLEGVLGTEILLDDFITDYTLEAGSLVYEVIALRNSKVINHPRLLASAIVPTLTQVNSGSVEDEMLYPLDYLTDAPITKISKINSSSRINEMLYQLVIPENDAFNVSIREIDEEIDEAMRIVGSICGASNTLPNLYIRPLKPVLNPLTFNASIVEQNCPSLVRYSLPILRDIIVTNKAVGSWVAAVEYDNHSVTTMGNFLITRNGVLRSTLPSHENPIPRNISEYLEFGADPNKFPPRTPTGFLLVSNHIMGQISLSKFVNVRVSDADDSKLLVMSVMGTGLEYANFSGVVEKLQSQVIDLPPGNFQTYLLDHKGYVVYPNSSQSSSFFGEVNSAVFKILVKRGYYVKNTFKDCLCVEVVVPEPLNSSGKTISLFLVDFVTKVLSLTMSTIFNAMMFVREGLPFIMPDTKITKECCREIWAYERDFNHHGKEYNSCEGDICADGEGNFCVELEDRNCSIRKLHSVEPVPNTNLLLVMTREHSDCNCTTEKQTPLHRVRNPQLLSECNVVREGFLNDDMCYNIEV